jgi:integrase
MRQSTKRQREPEVPTVEELKAHFEELARIYRTMVFVGGVVGLRVSEVMGLRWSEVDDERRRLSAVVAFGHVKQIVQLLARRNDRTGKNGTRIDVQGKPDEFSTLL